MDATEIRQALDGVFDQAIVFHAYTDYMRDYEVITYSTSDPRTGNAPTHDRLLFKYCVEASATTALTAEIWRRSLDERLITHETGVDLDGYVWGVRWQCNYPGAILVDGSAKAQEWAAQLGIPFYEVRFETNGHNLILVFSDLEVTRVGAGYSPFTVESGGPDFKTPLP